MSPAAACSVMGGNESLHVWPGAGLSSALCLGGLTGEHRCGVPSATVHWLVGPNKPPCEAAIGKVTEVR